eukprot:3860160-Pleurochrysis_carterae.AAC.1
MQHGSPLCYRPYTVTVRQIAASSCPRLSQRPTAEVVARGRAAGLKRRVTIAISDGTKCWCPELCSAQAHTTHGVLVGDGECARVVQ